MPYLGSLADVQFGLGHVLTSSAVSVTPVYEVTAQSLLKVDKRVRAKLRGEVWTIEEIVLGDSSRGEKGCSLVK